MYNIDASQFQRAIIVMQRLIHMGTDSSNPNDKPMSENNRNASVAQLGRLTAHAIALRCPVTELAIADLSEATKSDEKFTYKAFAVTSHSISQTLSYELTLKKVFVLDPATADFFAPKAALFGPDVAAKFPSITYEIDQAGKCIACQLSTAAVFHSIRCLEAVIRAIARSLGIPDPTKGSDRNWGVVLKVIKAEIDKRWPTSGDKMSGKGQFFDEVYGSLAAIQNPYRNATMHLDAKYDQAEAIHIFEVVKGLTVRVAAQIDEDGLPLA